MYICMDNRAMIYVAGVLHFLQNASVLFLLSGLTNFPSFAGNLEDFYTAMLVAPSDHTQCFNG